MPDWALYTLAVLALTAGLLGLWWSLLRDRARGRARCNCCWYDLTALVPGAPAGATAAPRCPECGRSARSVSALYRTRRRWGFATVALLLLLSAPVLALWPAVRRDGFWPTMPKTMVLLCEWLFEPAPGTALEYEFHRRFTEGGHADWQWKWFIERRYFTFRRAWPAGVPIMVPGLDVAFREGEGAMRTRIANGSRHDFILFPDSLTHEQPWRPFVFRLDPGETSIRCEVTFMDEPGRVQPRRIEWNIPLTVGGTIDDVLPPDPRCANPSYRFVDPDLRLVRLPTSGRLAVRTGFTALNQWGVALGVRVEVQHHGRAVAVARFAAIPGPMAEVVLLEGDAAALEHADPDDPAWKVVVRDDPEMALLDVEHRTRWVGRFEVPMRTFLHRPAR